MAECLLSIHQAWVQSPYCEGEGEEIKSSSKSEDDGKSWSLKREKDLENTHSRERNGLRGNQETVQGSFAWTLK
jgi:hypothetical protein